MTTIYSGCGCWVLVGVHAVYKWWAHHHCTDAPHWPRSMRCVPRNDSELLRATNQTWTNLAWDGADGADNTNCSGATEGHGCK